MSVLVIGFTLFLITNVSYFAKTKKVSKLQVRVTDKNFTDNFVTRNLDNFDPTNNQTFQQRYFKNDDYFNQTKRSLVFLQIGGESEIDADWMSNNVPWMYWAKQFNALAFQLEHRFYGSSSPTSNYTVDQLRYLTIEQALADIAYFIISVNGNYSFTHKPEWIVFGESYSGSLCTWARFKYPHLIKGAVCSSPQLIAKVNFPEYYDTVAEDIQDVSQECHDVIGEGFRQIQELAKTNSGREYLQNTALHLCQNLTDFYDQGKNLDDYISLMFDGMSFEYGVVAQYNRDNRFSYSGKKYTLDTLCSKFIINSTSNANKSAVERLGDYSRFYNDGECIAYNYTEWIQWYSDTTNSDRAWLWQTCTGLGLQINRVIGTPGNIFGTLPDEDFYVRLCSQAFPELDFSKQKQEALLNQTNLFYSALNIQYYSTNIVTTQGTYDPWYKAGILHSNNPDFTVILLDKLAHNANAYPPTETDSPELTAARIQIEGLISSWISC